MGIAPPSAPWRSPSRGRRQRRDQGVAEDQQGAPLRVREQVAGGEHADRIAHLPGDLRRVREHVQVARRGVARGDHQRLPLRVLADPVRPVSRAQPGRFPAAHRQLQRAVVELGVVDAADASLDPAGDPLPVRNIARPHRRLEAIRPVVGEPHRLLCIPDLHHRQGRPEGLLGHAPHRMIDLGQHGRLEEAAGLGLDPLPARDHPGALGHCVTHVRLDQLDLRREDDRPDVYRARRSRRPLAQRLDLGRHPMQELVIDGLLDVDALDGNADLA